MILTALVRKLMLKEMSLAFVGSNERVAMKIIERVKKKTEDFLLFFVI